jgi:hypothetical protein
VPELWTIPAAAKIRVLGPAAAIDALEPPPGVLAGRVAADEALWVADPGREDELVRLASEQVAAHGPAALVHDATDAWALFALVGEGGAETLARLASLHLPHEGSGFVQGQVSLAPGKVFSRPGRVDLLVGSDLAWFVHSRLLEAGEGAGLDEAVPPASEPVSNGAAVPGASS